MKPAVRGKRVAVIGASSLLGKELLNVLEERKFPVSRLVTFEDDEDEQALPIVDLTEHSQVIVADEDVRQQGRISAWSSTSTTIWHVREVEFRVSPSSIGRSELSAALPE